MPSWNRLSDHGEAYICKYVNLIFLSDTNVKRVITRREEMTLVVGCKVSQGVTAN